MSPTSHLRELDLLRKQVADLTRELRDRDQIFRERTCEIDDEVQDLRERSDMLRAIVTSTAGETGENFFPALVCRLSSVLGVQYALVGEVQPSPIRKIRTIAVSAGGSLVDNFEYPLVNTPCETALGQPFTCFERDIRTVFPLFGRLAQLGVEGYCGTPLRAKDGTVHGLLVLMDTKPLRNTDRLRSLMAVFASRAGAELQRRHFETKVQQQQRQLMEAQARVHLGSWDWDLDSGIVHWSDEQFRIFGYEPGRMAVNYDTFVTALHPLDRARVQSIIDSTLKGGTTYDVECRIIRPDGTIRTIHCRGEVYRDVDGRPVSLSSSVLDITNRQRVEEELRLSQGRLQQALRASGIGLWNWNTETNQVVYSEEWKRQLGYSGTELPDAFETWTTLLHPDDREHAVAYARQYRASPDGDYRQEFRLRHKDGTYRWIESRASFVTEVDGRRIHLLGSHTDMSDRKRMEEMIRESEERYRTLVELSPSGVFVFCEGRTVYVNRTGALLMGAQDPQEILDRPTFEFIHPDYHQEVRENVKRLLGGGISVHSAERVYVRMDGTTIPVQVEAGRITWDGKPAILGMFSDITERRRMEVERHRTLTLLTNVINATPDLIFVKDRDLRTMLCNNAFAQAVGKTPEEMIGHTDIENGWDAELVHGAPGKGIRGFEVDDRKALSGQGVHNPADPANVKGEVRFFDTYRLPLRSETGEVMGVLGVARDITRRLSMEVELKQSEARLQEAQRIAQLGSWELDLTANRLSWSHETHRIFEINKDQFDGSYETFLSAVHPEDRSAVQRAYTDSVRDKTPCEIVHRLFLPDGRVKYVQERCETIYDAQGAPQRSFGTVQDVTESTRLTQREAARVNQLNKLSQLSLTLSGDPAAIFKQVVRMIGELFKVRVVCLSEIVGQELHFKAVYINGQIVLDAGRCPLDVTPCATVEMDKDVRLYDHVMERFPRASFLQDHNAVSYCGFPSLDVYGQVVAVTCLLDDKPHEYTEEDQELLRIFGQRIAIEVERARHLAERKAAEEALRESEARFAIAFRASPHPIGITEVTTGRCIEVNDACLQLFGFSRENVIGSTTLMLGIWPNEEDRAQFIERVKTHRPVHNVEMNFKTKAGDVRHILVSSDLAELNGKLCLVTVGNDITDRKRAEEALANLNATLERQVSERTEALRRSEARFRQFFDHAPNVTCLKDHDGRYLYTNRRFNEVFRLAPGTALGRTDDELFSPEQAAQFQSHDQKVWTSCQGQEFEEITQQDDGPHTSIVVKFPVTDSAGQLSAIGIIATDVTERNRTQEALRESEARWQQFAESVSSAFWIADVAPEERQVLYVNSAFTFIWGIEREEIYQNWSLWLESIHPEDHMRVKTSHDRFIGGGATAVFHCEYRIVGRDGHIRWISDRRVRMPGWDHRIAGIAEDITHHKQQLALMAQTESIGKIGGWQFDFLTDRLWWSDETYRLLDTTPEVFSPTVEAALSFYTPECRPVMAEAWLKGVTQGQSWDLELELLTVQGRRIAVRATGQVDLLEGRAIRAYGTFQDITERKRAEEALQRAHDELERKVLERTAQLQTSEERYARATAVGKVGVWELDVLKGHYYGDTNLKMLFGYGPEELSTDPFRWLKLVHPDDQSVAMKNWERVQSGATDECHYELRMIRRDGSVIWTDVRGHGVRDSLGRLTHLIGATVDITERKQAERALQESEERFSKAFRASPHPIGITEAATGRCIEVNDACLELFGFRREEVIGNTTLVLGIWPHPDDRTRAIERLRSGQPIHNMEFALRTKSGAVRHLLASADLAELNGMLCVVTIANDITDRKQAEEALRISEERFAKAFQASPHPVVISELESGLVVDANEAAWQLFGYRKEEVVGQTTLEIGLWHSLEERTRYLELLKSQGSIRNQEVQLRSKNGDVRQCLLSSELIELNGKQCSVTVGDDITESRRLEKALRLTQFSVDQAVEAVLWLDPIARMFSVNDAACRMFEYSREELTAMTIHDIDPNFPVERWVAHWNYLKQQGALTFEAKFWSRKGAVLETDVTVNYLQHEGKEYACMILRDIGERKRAEAELRRSHAFLRQVIDTDPNFIFAKDRDGRFTMVNKSVADCYGTTVENLIGKSDADFNRDATEVEYFRQIDREVMNSLEERFIPEEKITDSAGRIRWLQTVKRPILDDCGQAHMVLGAATDITERKRMEEMLLQRERDLSAALQERERISQDLHDGILQALYAVGLGLEGCKPLIRQQPGPIAVKFMKALDQGIGQLNQVMGEVRNFIAGLESHVIQGGDFPTALRNLVATMSSSASAKCQARIDEASARQLSTEQALHLINIVREGVSNALRHSGATRITVSLRDLVRSVRLTITDNGVGFNTNSAQGIGHGLSNMAARAQKVHGVFSLQSTPRKGTKISLDLSKDVYHAHN